MTISLSLLGRLCGAMVLAAAGVACSGVAGGNDATTSAPSGAPAQPVAAVRAPAPAPVVAAAPAGTPRARLMAEIGDAACDTSQQCKTVPVGSKACGGPEAYLAYSTKRSDSARVAQLAAEDTAMRKKQDERSGMISNCMMLMDPGATCSAGRCVTAKPGAVAS